MDLIAIASDEDGDDERTSSETQFHGYRHARYGQWEGTEDQSQEDTHEDSGDVRSIQFAGRVTHLIRHTVDSILRTYYHDFVTHLQRECSRSEEVHAMTGDTCDIHTMNTREMHRRERLTVDFRVGDEDTLGYQRLVLLFKVDVEFRTDKGRDGLLVSLCADDEHLVALMEDGVAVGNAQFALVYQTRHHEVAVQEVVHL